MKEQKGREAAPLVFIVEDNEVIARLVARLLKRNGCDVAHAGDVSGAMRLIDAKIPDLFILDVTLPDGDGYEVCREIRKKTDAPVLFLTGKTALNEKIAGLGSGGDYYLTKPYEPDELLAVVKSLLRRGEQTKKRLDEASVIVKGPITLKLKEGRAYLDGRDAELTPKEFALLHLLVANEGKEVSSKTIYKQIWGADMNNDTSALRQQISRLKKKIGEETAEKFSINNEHGRGYIFTSS